MEQVSAIGLDPVAARIEPDVKQALTFFATLFAQERGSVVHFRGVAEPADGRTQQNLHYTLDENFTENVRGFLEWCQVDQRAAFFLPGIVRGNGTGKADVLSLPAVLVDFDKGNPDENLAKTEALIGPATIVVESGGRTESGPKLHAYWRLAVPATGAELILACSIREQLAIQFGGDPAFKQAAQVIRLPGSIHFKGTPKLVQLRTVRPEAVYSLAALTAKMSSGEVYIPSPDRPTSNIFDFSRDRPAHNDVERALTAPVHEGGVDDITRFEAAGKAIGHFIRMVREGRMSPDEAWTAAKDWNAATLIPPWSEDRLATDFARLVRADEQSRGPLVQVTPVVQQTQAAGWSLTDWRSDRFSGPAPERRWLVDGLVPLGTAGVFAAVGDAGKSMMSLQLALHVTTAPVVQSGSLDFGAPNFFGQPIVGRGAAVVLTAEDDAAEVHRRLNSLDPAYARSNRPLYVVPMLATGGARSILASGPSGPVQTEFWAELKAQLMAIPDLKLVVLDPLSAFVAGDTNDNELGAALMFSLNELATLTGAAVMLVHHFAKAMVPTDLTDARTAIRGAGALVDNGRWALALWEAEQDRAYGALKALGQQDRARQSGLVYLGGLAKGNAPGAKTLRTLVRSGTGLLVDQTDAIGASAPRADEIDDTVLRALRAYKRDRTRWSFSISKNSVAKYIEPVLLQAKIDISLRAAESCLRRLLERGLIVETETPGKYEPAPD
jgi:hypothetical protein